MYSVKTCLTIDMWLCMVVRLGNPVHCHRPHSKRAAQSQGTRQQGSI